MSPCRPDRAPRRLPARTLAQARSRPLKDSANPALHLRPFPRGRVETAVDLRGVHSDVLEVSVVEVAQRRPCRRALAACDCDCDPTVEMTAHARQKDGGSAPGNRRGRRGKNVFEYSHQRILSNDWSSEDLSSLQCYGDSLNMLHSEG